VGGIGENFSLKFESWLPLIFTLPHTTHAWSQSVPVDLTAHIAAHATNGYRVLAFAERVLPNSLLDNQSDIDRISRELLETDMTFVGVVALENRLKLVTADVIQELHSAQVGGECGWVR
jgi:magnesium-transporting ATPase (P-type)